MREKQAEGVMLPFLESVPSGDWLGHLWSQVFHSPEETGGPGDQALLIMGRISCWGWWQALRFLKAPDDRNDPSSHRLPFSFYASCTWEVGLASFKSSPGESTVQPELRITETQPEPVTAASVEGVCLDLPFSPGGSQILMEARQ